MRYLLAISLLLGATAWAASTPGPQPTGQVICPHSSSTAKIALAMLYTAEKAYRSENAKYGQNLLELGVDQVEVEENDTTCDSKYWSLKAYVRKSGEAFTGICTSLITGETWVINEKKQLKQIRKASNELPKAHVQEMPR